MLDPELLNLRFYLPFAGLFFVMGLSHILQPAMWRDYFMRQHSYGFSGVITISFVLELWPALAIVVFHQVWSGLAVVLTIYGHILLAKVVLAFLYPRLRMRSLSMAQEHGTRGFVWGGGMLLGMGAICAALAVSG